MGRTDARRGDATLCCAGNACSAVMEKEEAVKGREREKGTETTSWKVEKAVSKRERKTQERNLDEICTEIHL